VLAESKACCYHNNYAAARTAPLPCGNRFLGQCFPTQATYQQAQTHAVADLNQRQSTLRLQLSLLQLVHLCVCVSEEHQRQSNETS